MKEATMGEGKKEVHLTDGSVVDFNNPRELAQVSPPGLSYRSMIQLADNIAANARGVPVLSSMFEVRDPNDSILQLYNAAVRKHRGVLIAMTDLPMPVRDYIFDVIDDCHHKGYRKNSEARFCGGCGSTLR